jgi:hypothetical protein
MLLFSSCCPLAWSKGLEQAPRKEKQGGEGGTITNLDNIVGKTVGGEGGFDGLVGGQEEYEEK